MLQRFYWSILFSACRKRGAVQMDSNCHPFLIMLPHYGRTGEGSVSWKELFHLVFLIRGQIDWSHFVFKVIQQG